ncbi:cytochrome C biogenesis protein [Helicobacter valdiviensis]|uniref:Cytochrome C biogenesis protein n=1 Tax=Helicobacter valdiviensis TaxID=1458358 RepID=A0A2W6MWB9_9HELI|nr:cytochrome c biogenesis protein CcdA [Helicobacter valdiviensis]PZT48794.1 cytochrome C biogenesis protein [Helicobacter valdiviensis]
MEESLLVFLDKAPLLISFLAGILTFISPCILPLVPAYLSYISEISLSELKGEVKINFATRLIILRSAVFFVLGLGIVFVLMGAISARILNGGILLSPYVAYIAGGVLIVFGIHTMGIIQIPFLNYQKTFAIKGSNFTFLRDFFTPFLLGISFSLGWTPCVGPILAGIISLASLEAGRGIMLMVFYTLGLSIPFLLCALLIGSSLSILNKIKAYFKWIEWVAGGLLIIIGILVASGGISKISDFLTKFYQ